MCLEEVEVPVEEVPAEETPVEEAPAEETPEEPKEEEGFELQAPPSPKRPRTPHELDEEKEATPALSAQGNKFKIIVSID